MKRLLASLFAATLVLLAGSTLSAEDKPPQGFVSLFNGKDLAGWKVPPGDNGHWKVVGGVIDYDARSESKEKDKSLWTGKPYRDFILRVDWRLKKEKGFVKAVPIIAPDGNPTKEMVEINGVDSGIYLRGSSKSQINIWTWPAGSGEIWGYRTDKKMPAAVRAACTPKKKADKPVGEWNTFEITVKGDRVWVKLNGEEVISNAQLPDMPKAGPIALQHHGAWDMKEGKWKGPPSLVQFRNIQIKEVK